MHIHICVGFNTICKVAVDSVELADWYGNRSYLIYFGQTIKWQSNKTFKTVKYLKHEYVC